MKTSFYIIIVYYNDYIIDKQASQYVYYVALHRSAFAYKPT